MLIRQWVGLFEINFDMSSSDNRMFNGNSQPKLLKSAEASTTES